MEQDLAQLRLEQLHLKETLDNARGQLAAIQQRLGTREAELMAAQEELRDEAEHAQPEAYSAQGFHDLVELSQLTQPMAGDIEGHAQDTRLLRMLKQMLQSPYFARIDFLFDGENDAEPFYIGRGTLMAENGVDVAVCDWRAPVASLFYRHGLGPAAYRAPSGVMTGLLRLKRQYEIQCGALEYFFDAEVQIVDEFLRELLSRSASPVMKAIVETIQKDQDEIIRDMDSEVLLVQGAAGSGKTSVALHRIAYLMYRGLAGRLNADELLVLSPNAVFERYIAQVLPELGEASVKTLLLEEVLQEILPETPVETRAEAVESLLADQDEQRAGLCRATAAFKGSPAFITLLDRLVAEMPQRWVSYQDVWYDGQCLLTVAESRTVICEGKRAAPVGQRLQWLEHTVLERVRARRGQRLEALTAQVLAGDVAPQDVAATARMLSLAETAEFLQKLRAMTGVDCAALYRRLFTSEEDFARLAEGLALPPEIAAIRRLTMERLDEPRWRFDDAAALAYLRVRAFGCATYRRVRQVVLDEAQDEAPLHFALLRDLFPQARFTILGDTNQAVARSADASLYDQIAAILRRPQTERVTLTKSFRCTEQIWRFAARLLPPDMVGECFSRGGAEPGIHMAPDEAARDVLLLAEIAESRRLGHAAIALICKTEQSAAALYERLHKQTDLHLVRGSGEDDACGVFVISLYMAKGLEFDAVLIADADAAHYARPEEKSLLYVACTRALHRLQLFGVGQASPWLG